MQKLFTYLIAGSLLVGSRSLHGQGLGIYHPKPSLARLKAQVEGDVYYVTRSGVVKRLASNEVRLFFADSVAEPMRKACHLIDSLRHAPVVDQAALDAANTSISTQLQKAMLAYSPTGPAAQYKFLISRPGHYLLFAETTDGKHRYQFIKPLPLQGGERERVDLDTASMTQKPYCIHP